MLGSLLRAKDDQLTLSLLTALRRHDVITSEVARLRADTSPLATSSIALLMILDWAADERIWRLMADCAVGHAIGAIVATCPNARPATCRELLETMHRAPNVIGRAAAGCAAPSARSP